jgi:hypothetical protein
MEHDQVSGTFDGNRGVSSLARRAVFLPDHMDSPARKEELLQSARIWEKGLYCAAPELAADQEPVWPVQEGGGLNTLEDAKGP